MPGIVRRRPIRLTTKIAPCPLSSGWCSGSTSPSSSSPSGRSPSRSCPAPGRIRTRNAVVLQYLLVMTRIFGTASLGVLVFGIILGQQQKELSQAWLTVS